MTLKLIECDHNMAVDFAWMHRSKPLSPYFPCDKDVRDCALRLRALILQTNLIEENDPRKQEIYKHWCFDNGKIEKLMIALETRSVRPYRYFAVPSMCIAVYVEPSYFSQICYGANMDVYFHTGLQQNGKQTVDLEYISNRLIKKGERITFHEMHAKRGIEASVSIRCDLLKYCKSPCQCEACKQICVEIRKKALSIPKTVNTKKKTKKAKKGKAKEHTISELVKLVSDDVATRYGRIMSLSPKKPQKRIAMDIEKLEAVIIDKTIQDFCFTDSIVEFTRNLETKLEDVRDYFRIEARDYYEAEKLYMFECQAFCRNNFKTLFDLATDAFLNEDISLSMQIIL